MPYNASTVPTAEKKIQNHHGQFTLQCMSGNDWFTPKFHSKPPPPLHPLRQPKEAKTSVCHWIGHKRSKKMMTVKHTVIADMSYKIYNQ